uniref:FI10923p n=1 Tax=Drosophila melanogaster TaxID=7227 RepID=B7Z0N9_DROME|eukprot:NP_001138096.1 uncharacterized protein Dmel_CG31178 [Drosophila melanogaster]
MSGSRRRRTVMGYYEYIMPGIYEYPLIQCDASAIRSYSIDSIMTSASSTWSIPDSNAAYVAGPMGVIHYQSDMQTHLALPTRQNLETGLIYPTIESNSCFHEPNLEYVQMENEHTDDDEGYGYEIPEIVLCLNRSNSESGAAEESGDSQRSSKSYSSVEISEQSRSGEYVKLESVFRRRRKVSQKRKYTTEQGYLVEEPTSEPSEEDAEEQAPKSRK